MEGIMPAVNSSKNIVVDKNDIFQNIKSVKNDRTDVDDFFIQASTDAIDIFIAIGKGALVAIRDFVLGIVMLIPVVLVMTPMIFMIIPVALCVVLVKYVSDEMISRSENPPKWLIKANDVTSGIISLVPSPWEMVEGICQDVNDANEKEGIFCSGSYVVTTVGLIIVTGGGYGEAKAASIAAEKALSQAEIKVLNLIIKSADTKVCIEALETLTTKGRLNVLNLVTDEQLVKIINAMSKSGIDELLAIMSNESKMKFLNRLDNEALSKVKGNGTKRDR